MGLCFDLCTGYLVQLRCSYVSFTVLLSRCPLSFDSRLLESLLYEEEGTALDFKSAQYPFNGASDNQKAELLKDILAFANSWRRTTAYILIGVEEVKGGRSKVVGVTEDLDDAILHQFVNSKTQRPIEFSYRLFSTGGVKIGVIEIPIQERPFYLSKRFGKLHEDAVYIRDGSSTRTATPDEIVKMGAEQVLGDTPQFALAWADLDKQIVLPSPYTQCTLSFNPILPPDTFEYGIAPRSPLHVFDNPPRNADYSREAIAHADDMARFTPLGFCLYNDSSVVGKRVCFVGSMRKADGIVVKDGIEPEPRKVLDYSYMLENLSIGSDNEPEAHLQGHDDRWEVRIDFGDIRPHEKVWTGSPLWFGSWESTTAKLEGELLGDNLPEPIPCSLTISLQVKTRRMSIEDVEPYLDQR